MSGREYKNRHHLALSFFLMVTSVNPRHTFDPIIPTCSWLFVLALLYHRFPSAELRQVHSIHMHQRVMVPGISPRHLFLPTIPTVDKVVKHMQHHRSAVESVQQSVSSAANQPYPPLSCGNLYGEGGWGVGALQLTPSSAGRFLANPRSGLCIAASGSKLDGLPPTSETHA